MTHEEFLNEAVYKSYRLFCEALEKAGNPPLTPDQDKIAVAAIAFGLAYGAGISIAEADQWRKMMRN